MAAIVYRSAVLLIAGAQLNCQFSELTLEYSAEMLDATTFCDSGTRTRAGGLKAASLTGRGFLEFGDGSIEQVLFDLVGDADQVVTVFANGVTEGSLEQGYAMKGVLREFNIGGRVGELWSVDMAIDGAGILAS